MQAMPVLQTFLPNSNLLNANLPANLAGNLTGNPSGPFASTSSQLPINCEALYAQVNKLAKTNKKFSQHPSNDLYAKGQERSKLLESGLRKIHSSTPDVQNASLNSVSLSGSVKERPPLPPPLDNIPKNPKSNHPFPIKSNTNLSHPESSYANQFGLNVYPQHRRSFSSGGQYDSDYDNLSKLPDDHNYEKVKKIGDDQLDDDDKEIVEAEYETIKPPQTSSDEDTDSPCYETIKTETKQIDECISEPNYETIRDVGKMPPFNRLSRTESDASADPGYERIRPGHDNKIDGSTGVDFVNIVERL